MPTDGTSINADGTDRAAEKPDHTQSTIAFQICDRLLSCFRSARLTPYFSASPPQMARRGSGTVKIRSSPKNDWIEIAAPLM